MNDSYKIVGKHIAFLQRRRRRAQGAS